MRFCTTTFSRKIEIPFRNLSSKSHFYPRTISQMIREVTCSALEFLKNEIDDSALNAICMVLAILNLKIEV